MTDQSAQEPTMEEILASIRRIISEDDAPAETAAAPEPEAEAEIAPEPVAESPALMDETPSMQEPAAVEDDVLELTDEAPQTIGDLEVAPSAPDPEPAPEPEPEPVFAATPKPVEAPAESLVGTAAAASAASSFAGLSASLRKPEPAEPTFASGPTIDALARELLRPMLKDWLDANLPAIVEAQVRKEVERIARQAN